MLRIYIFHHDFPDYGERMEHIRHIFIDWMGLDCGLTLL